MKKIISGAVMGTAICGLVLSTSAFAYEFQAGSVEGSLNSTLGMGFGNRLRNPSSDITGVGNPGQWSGGDDGNLNYKKGDFYSAYIKGNHELLLKAPDGWKGFVRGIWKYDFKAEDTRRTDLSSAAEDQIVLNAELLDLWVSKNFSLGGENGRIKVGNQVISWGEPLFYIGGVSNNVLDFQKLLVPGTQMKEAFLPVPAISVSTSLPAGLTAEAFVQANWRRTRVAPVGSYFSASDIYDKGRVPVSFNGTNFNMFGQDQYSLTDRRNLTDTEALDAITANGDFGAPILGDKKPKEWDLKQVGLSAHWTPPDSKVNFGAYITNYHDQFPVLNLVNGGAYQWEFLQNRQMYGLTANFPVGNWAVGTEYSYRPHDAVALSGGFNPGGPLDVNTNGVVGIANLPLYKDFQKHQWSVTGMLQLSPGDHGWFLDLLRADTGFLTAETAVTHYPGVSKGVTRSIEGVPVHQVAAAGYFVPLDKSNPAAPITAALGTDTSWGYTVDFNVTYDGKIIPGWQVTPGVTLSHSVLGDTPNYTAQFLEGNMSTNIYVLFNQNPAKWQAGINYTVWYSDPWQKNTVVERQYLKDRNLVGGFVSYSF
ncbi:MAG: DUF1302 domain-containing protein [Desulfuromonadaceae bacterium]|nr:DUF1302 domain-containing protein [Desulfuromonadaceae bacterium]